MMIYKEGFEFSFDEKACEKCGGKCCVGSSGNIFANEEEIKALSLHFALQVQDFKNKFMKKVGLRYSFKEYKFKEGFACIFFDEKKQNCSIYELRPKQCRTFPFWQYFKKHKEELKNECIGVCF